METVKIPLGNSAQGKEMGFGSAKYAVSQFMHTNQNNSPFREELNALRKSDVSSMPQHLIALDI